MAPPLTLVLWVSIGVLMVDSIIELSFVSSMVAWLHRRAGRDFEIAYNGSTYPLHGKPLNLLVNQGHTSNGAAGTAFVLIGMGGILALWLRTRTNGFLGKFGKFWYTFWLVMTIPSMLLSLAALIYTMVLTYQHDNQTISNAVASQLNNHPYPNYVAYPLDSWTPENWFDAVLKLDLVNSSDRSNIEEHLRVMRGWRWNLIPMFIIGLAVSAVAFAEFLIVRRRRGGAGGVRELEQKSLSS
ncbi:hypothetical protein M409DRAFT_28442 [Zasmidium cellare ATCC 36951]|uniref:Uncharacterized protein n=1 Tax=Zasmidium cellare ATCC 36951 TaxID=1080233 RepID=A0A6A6C5G6_ZASCE|nr:uncharacterized protein M409DRAFT_28442 [Zasmidium cellare ATCC 36951]KAF2161112.1 hypothetical protein M409DRAFT_28442 [Zasmidium cellare ATCC 36951]